MNNANVVTRSAKLEDKSFILATWLRGNYYGNDYFRQMEKNLYMKEYTSFIVNKLNNPLTKIEVAVLEEDSNTIFSFIVYQGSNILWAYTKKDYRNKGLLNLLVKGKDLTTVSSTTKVGQAITKKKSLIFNPLI